MKNWKRGVWLLAAIFAITAALNLFSTSVARAEDEKPKHDTKLYELEIMTVTAEKREENIQDVPVSITALSETQIEDSGITSIKDSSLQIPNLTIANWGTRRVSYVFTRGIGSTNNAPAVGFYVDDVAYFEWGTFDIDLFDIERIEVLRGPQGTLYGRNTLGGVCQHYYQKTRELRRRNRFCDFWELRSPGLPHGLTFAGDKRQTFFRSLRSLFRPGRIYGQ